MMRRSITVVDGETKANFIDTIRINLSVFKNKGYLTLLGVTFGILFFVQLYRYYRGEKLNKKNFLIILLY